MQWFTPARFAALSLAILVASPVSLHMISMPSSRASSSSPHNVLVATDRTEPSIVVNPAHRDDLIAGSNPDYDEHNPAGVADGHFFSTNGGRSWSGGEMPVVSPYTAEADPQLAVDSHGVVYYSFLGESPSYCSNGSSAVLLSKSTDGGRHFGTPVIVDGGAAVHDKDWLAVESVRGHRDHVFVVWDQPLPKSSRVFVQRSVDGGKTFSRPYMLENSPWLNYGAVPAVGPRGRITVAWASFPARSMSGPGPERIVARTSYDDGLKWAPRISPSRGYFKSVPIALAPYNVRVLPMPSMTVSPSGAIFVAWARMRHAWTDGRVTSDILMARSQTGSSWSKAVVVNDSRSHDRFMPSVTSLGDKEVGVAFYDQRSGYGVFDVYAARVYIASGGLRVGRNIRITDGNSPTDLLYDVPNTSCYEPGRFLGDYIGSAANGSGRFYVIWSDTHRHVHNVSDLWSASLPLK